MTAIVLVDDQEMIRAGLAGILSSDPGIEVVAQYPDALSMLREIEQVRPDVVLLDIQMPGITGVEATARLRRLLDHDQLRILILTTFEEDAYVLDALRNGADGFLSKAVGPRELLDAVKSVAGGGGALSPGAAAVAIHGISATPAPPARDPEVFALFADLTERELEVVDYVKDGLGNDEIAGLLFISPLTVKTHVRRIMAKVGAHDRAQLVALAHRAGL